MSTSQCPGLLCKAKDIHAHQSMCFLLNRNVVWGKICPLNLCGGTITTKPFTCTMVAITITIGLHPPHNQHHNTTTSTLCPWHHACGAWQQHHRPTYTWTPSDTQPNRCTSSKAMVQQYSSRFPIQSELPPSYNPCPTPRSQQQQQTKPSPPPHPPTHPPVHPVPESQQPAALERCIPISHHSLQLLLLLLLSSAATGTIAASAAAAAAIAAAVCDAQVDLEAYVVAGVERAVSLSGTITYQLGIQDL